MNYQTLFAEAGERTVRAGLVGVGEFGTSLIGRTRAIPNLDVPALCDRVTRRAVVALEALGWGDDDITVADSEAAALAAFEAGQRVVVPDAALLMALPLDILIEATGLPEVAARNALDAIQNGKHVAMVSKEAESVVGPILYRRARQAGLVYTTVDGDQPSLLIGLVSWSRVLGLDIVAAGKSSEYDFIYDPEAGAVSRLRQSVGAPGLGAHWLLAPKYIARGLAARAELLAGLPQKTAPDLCEMGVVSNATGLRPDTAAFHAPVARTVELPDIFRPQNDGGILSGTGIIDIFNCLRRPDEASFAGGVFVVVAGGDPATWALLAGKGIPVSAEGKYALIHNPVHLLGVEAPISILSAVLLGRSSFGDDMAPVSDLVGRARRDLAAGTEMALGRRHEIDGLEPLLVDAGAVEGGNPIPFYMLAGNRLAVDVPAGTVIGRDMVAAPEGSTLWALRGEQDATFFARQC